MIPDLGSRSPQGAKPFVHSHGKAATRVGSQIANRSGSIPVPPQEIVVGIPAELLRRRPDVQQAERAAALQSARIGIAEAEFYPHIAITGTIGVQAQNFSNLFNSQSLVGQIGPGFNWNLLNYGRIKNNVLAQDARFQQAVLTYRDTVLRANEEVENGIVSFLREQDRVASLTGSTNAAARSVATCHPAIRKGHDRLSAALGFRTGARAATRHVGRKPRTGRHRSGRRLQSPRRRLAGTTDAAADSLASHPNQRANAVTLACHAGCAEGYA